MRSRPANGGRAGPRLPGTPRRPAKHPARGLARKHQPEQREQQRGDLPVLEQTHGELQLLPNPTGADEAQHGGRADGALERVEAVAHEAGQRLGDEREQHESLAAPARRGEHLHRRGIDLLEEVRVHAAEDPGVGDPERQRTGARAEAHRDDEEQRPEELGHGPEDPQRPTRGEMGCEEHRGECAVPRAERSGPEQRGRREDAQRHREEDREHRARDANGERARHRSSDDDEEAGREVRREQAPDQAAEALERSRVDERPRRDLCRGDAPGEERSEEQELHGAPGAEPGSLSGRRRGHPPAPSPVSRGARPTRADRAPPASPG